MFAYNEPSSWVAACLPPITGRASCPNEGTIAYRRNLSHFSTPLTIPGDFRFNALHLDGHVDDSIWRETQIGAIDWLVNGPKLSIEFYNHAYGWEWPSATRSAGWEKDPEFDGRFDEDL